MFCHGHTASLAPFGSSSIDKQFGSYQCSDCSTGAGVGLSPTTHFSWRNQNVSWYKPFTHQHLDEIEETLFSKQEARELLFLPQRGNFTRGIFATAYTRYDGSLQEVQDLFENLL